jgi:hypothetical protein
LKLASSPAVALKVPVGSTAKALNGPRCASIDTSGWGAAGDQSVTVPLAWPQCKTPFDGFAAIT